ncbi:MAG: hypothetical protein AB1458_05285 [Bacteroidota bacterium]
MKKALFILLLFTGTSAGAQLGINVEATLDTNEMRIGEQTTLRIKIRYQRTNVLKIEWPRFNDTIIKGIEIVKTGRFVDAPRSKGNKVDYIQSRDFVITSFDEGNYLIPSLRFILNNDSNQYVETNPLPLRVKTVDVDTTADFKDIKPPIHEPLTFEDLALYVWITAGLAAAALVFFLVRRYLKNKKQMYALADRSRPAHEIALNALEKLKKEKMWKKGKDDTKEHHTRVSEIVRTFLERSFGINAMEMPTYDILTEVEKLSISRESKNVLRLVLHLTDMVKFAKEVPTDLQNEVVVDDAVKFVKANIPKPVAGEQEDEKR